MVAVAPPAALQANPSRSQLLVLLAVAAGAGLLGWVCSTPATQSRGPAYYVTQAIGTQKGRIDVAAGSRDGYSKAGLVPLWAWDVAPKNWKACTYKVPFEGPTKVPKATFDRIPLTRYSAYFNLAEWLLDNPDKARGHGLEISGASFLQQFFADGTTWDRRNYPEVDVMALHKAIAPESYDWIILDQVLEHVALPFLAVAEIHRALKPGGRLLLAVPFFNPYHNGPQDYWRMSHDALRVMLSIFSEVEMCGTYRSMSFIRNFLDRSEQKGEPAFAILSGVPNQESKAFEIAKGDPALLTDGGELQMNKNQFLIHSWAIARK